MRYTYSIIRFVPDPATGEFINIGAIAGNDDANDWAIRIVRNMSRARRLDDGRGLLRPALLAVSSIQEMVEASQMELPFRPPSTMNEKELWRIFGEWRNIIQLSEPMPLSAESADQALDLVFYDLVVDPQIKHRRDRRWLHAEMKRAFAKVDLRIGTDVAERPLITRGPYRERFSFAVANGQVIQLTQIWSFQIAGVDDLLDEVKAWAWLVSHIRDKAGFADTDRGRLKIPRDVDVVAVYESPSNDAGKQALKEAKAAARELNATLVRAGEIEGVAHRAKELMASAAA